MILPCVKRANTQIQIHKYTNTAYDEVPERPNMQYILKKRIVQAYQKLYSHVSNAQMQNKVPKRPNMWYIFEKAIVQGYLLSLAQLYKVWLKISFGGKNCIFFLHKKLGICWIFYRRWGGVSSNPKGCYHKTAKN